MSDATADSYGPEVSDVIVDYDAATLARKPVAKAAALARLAASPAPARRVAATLAADPDGTLDPDAVDGILVRSHLELQRLHEEFRVGAMMRNLLAPLIALVRGDDRAKVVRIVDLGCGLGYIVRWLAARGALGDGVELVGADYNLALVGAARELAAREQLACRFVAGNAFALAEPADIVMSTGVLHHFRGDDLAAVFAQHEKSTIRAFVHVDIRPSLVAPLGSWIFHAARMREPLAKFDGYWSAVRAHAGPTLCAAIAAGAPSFAVGTVDARPGLAALLRIFQAAIGVRADLAAALPGAYRSLGRRFAMVAP